MIYHFMLFISIICQTMKDINPYIRSENILMSSLLFSKEESDDMMNKSLVSGVFDLAFSEEESDDMMNKSLVSGVLDLAFSEEESDDMMNKSLVSGVRDLAFCEDVGLIIHLQLCAWNLRLRCWK